MIGDFVVRPLGLGSSPVRALSLAPLKNVKRLLASMNTYASECQAAALGASVFGIDAGLRAVAITDTVSANFFFNAPETVLSRESIRRFGPFALAPQILGKARPALLERDKPHLLARDWTEAIVRQRSLQARPALRYVLDTQIDRWVDAGSFELSKGLTQLTARFAFRWLLDVEVDVKDVVAWLDEIGSLSTDAPLASLVAKFVLPKPTMRGIQAANRLRNQVESSTLFEQFVNSAEEHGIPLDDVADWLIFTCLFNVSGGTTKTLVPSLVTLVQHPELLKRLRDESKGDPDDIVRNPWINALFLECLRLFPRPRFVYREARNDLTLPSRGANYDIKRGELIVALMPIVHRDPHRFTLPDQMIPERFLDTPSLNESVWGFGPLTSAPSRYGCNGHAAGSADELWKMILVELLGRWDLVLPENPSVGEDSFEVSDTPITASLVARDGAVR